jgi:hypothetical protein
VPSSAGATDADGPRAQCRRVFASAEKTGHPPEHQLQSRTAAAADCVGDWAADQVLEFRDGVKRGWRAGVDTIRIGVVKLRSKLGSD